MKGWEYVGSEAVARRTGLNTLPFLRISLRTFFCRGINMDDPNKYFFVKFKVDRKKDLMKSMIISEDKSKILNWSGSKGAPRKAPKEQDAADENIFTQVSLDFQKTIDLFHRSIPLLLGRFTSSGPLFG